MEMPGGQLVIWVWTSGWRPRLSRTISVISMKIIVSTLGRESELPLGPFFFFLEMKMSSNFIPNQLNLKVFRGQDLET